jgi:2-methylcitrate dehydratase PrpD
MSTVQNLGDGEVQVTAPLASFAANIGHNETPADTREVARQCLLDVLGVTLAGAKEPLVEMLSAEAEEAGGAPQATVIGRGFKTSASQAALVNGSAAHALDYDDVLSAMSGHPTVPVFPTLLALAERDGMSGRDVITAFVAGVEVEARIGLMMARGHYAKGWHSTGTIGTFASAAASGRLLGLDEDTMAKAFGIAGTQAAGLKSMFGTMCKPFHAGKAAMNGMMAASLAKRGFSTREDVLDCEQGFTATQSNGGVKTSAAVEGLGKEFNAQDVLFKYHAACYGVHGPIEAAIKAAEHPAFDPDLIERIDLTVNQHCIGMCDIAEPVTGLEGKFSMTHNVALGLLGKANGALSLYEDERMSDDAPAELRSKVSIKGVQDQGPFEAKIAVHLKGGIVIQERYDVEEPESDLARQWEKLEGKFRALATPVIGAEKAEEVIQLCRNFDSADSVKPLMDAVRG